MGMNTTSPDLSNTLGKSVSPSIQGNALTERVDFFRLEAIQKLKGSNRSEKGQFFTPPGIARFMASMFTHRPDDLRILDAGAGVGSLSTALITEALGWEKKPISISLTAYEIEPILIDRLRITLDYCQEICQREGIVFTSEIIPKDFIKASVDALSTGVLFERLRKTFNAAILNPPYKKIDSSSLTRRLLRNVEIETSNLYAAFLWLAIKLLEPDGELVAITPRSYCNGPYFLPFRRALMKIMSIRRIHVFDYRDRAFQEDEVLQENVILHALKSSERSAVTVSSSSGPEDEFVMARTIEHDQLVYPDDPDLFIHIAPDELKQHVGRQIRHFSTSLEDLDITVSTGRVVDFRAENLLRKMPEEKTAPLLYPKHFSSGWINWPGEQNKKPNAIKTGKEAKDLLVPSDWYVLVKRFSAKEEKRRVVAAVFDPTRVKAKDLGIENHLNYYHQEGRGLSPTLAKGLALFLNSTFVDEYFRQFSGHTQVNATDLRSLKYPTKEQLFALGETIGATFPAQDELDQIVLERLGMSKTDNDLKTMKKVEEALEILRALRVPKEQINQRSGLALLALLDMKPETQWGEASSPLRGITEMMDYFRDHFGVTYAPNTRETVRRFTIHQFVQMGLVIPNPDNPRRPVNSPNNRYQVETGLLKLIRNYGKDEWGKTLKAYLEGAKKLKRLQAKEREMVLIPIRLPDGSEVKITAGGQNTLIKQIIEEFCPRFTPGGSVVYLGDAGDKFRIYEREFLEKLGNVIDEHSKMPDVVIYLENKNWLVLVEAVTSHGPINLKRNNELKELFKGSKAPLVFVTAFPTRRIMVKYLQEIAWETEVWVAEAPSHLIHFNGERFLGPYET